MQPVRILIALALVMALGSVNVLPARAHEEAAVCEPLSAETSDAADTPENRRVVAEKYVKGQAMAEMNRRFMEQFAAGLPEPRRSHFLQMADDMLDIKELEKVTVDLLVNHFTVDELTFMDRHDNSPQGQAINRKMPDFMAALVPQVMAIMLKGVTMKATPLAPADSP